MEYPFPPLPFLGIQWSTFLPHAIVYGLILTVASLLIRQSRRSPSLNNASLWVAAAWGIVLTIFVVFRDDEGLLFTDEQIQIGAGLLWCITFLGATVSIFRWSARNDDSKVKAVSTITLWTILSIAFVFPALLPPQQSVRHAAKRTQCRNNLKQLGLAMHQFHDHFEHFPAFAEGNPPQSWRIWLLPYVDQAALYSEYHLTEPWDGPANMEIQARRPTGYACVSDMTLSTPAGRSLTSYVAITGPGSMFLEGRRPQISDIADGTSNTIMLVEAAGLRRIWTEPRDADRRELPIAINHPGIRPGESHGLISSYHTGGAHVLNADGSVRFVSEKVDPKVLESHITPAGHEYPVDF